jgi:Ricin-type beta-trefoil lectin domain
MTISFARLGRIAVAAAVTAVPLAGALAGTASAVTLTGHDPHAKAAAPAPAASGNAMCLDASTPPRSDGGPVYLWQCEPGNSNQVWAIDGGQLIVKDTLGTPAPMCLDVNKPPRSDGGPVYLWQCEPGNSNQAWAIDGGQLIVKDTLS